MKEKYFWMAIILAGVIWTGNYTYLKAQQLAEPIFLKHYYEVSMKDRIPLEFYYLTNKGNPVTVNGISINGIHLYTTQDGFMFHSEGPQFKEEYIHHHLRSFSVEFSNQQIPVKEGSKDEWTFTEFTPSFDNGIAFNHPAKIGYVNLRGDGHRGAPLKFEMSGSSSTRRSQYKMSAKKTLMIEEIKVPLLDRFPGLVEVKVHDLQGKLTGKEEDIVPEELSLTWDKVPGTSLHDTELPLELKEDDWITIHSNIDKRNKMFLKFNIWIIGKTSNGESFEIPLLIHEEPFLDQEDIRDIISEQEGGDAR